MIFFPSFVVSPLDEHHVGEHVPILIFWFTVNANSASILQITGDEAPEVAKSEEWSEAADMYCLGLVMWEILCEKRPTRTQQQLLDGFVPEIPIEIQEQLKLETSEGQYLLDLITACLSLQPSNRPSSKLVLKRISKIHDVIIGKPDFKPSKPRRRKTRERGLGGRQLKKSTEDASELISTTYITPDMKVESAIGNESGVKSPRSKKHTPVASSSAPTAVHKKNSSTIMQALKPPPSPSIIVTDVPSASPSSLLTSNSASHLQVDDEEETEPRRVSMDTVLELQSPKVMRSHKSKKSKHEI
jgi:serine/threonine protein kinase